jgi:hypothetical protein
MNRLAAACTLALSLALPSLVPADELLKVTDGKTPPVDTRLGKPRDYNTVTHWTPMFADRAEWEKRAKEVREQILISQGLYPLPEKTPLNAVVHGRIDKGDYTIEKVYFASLPGHYVTGNLYRPKNATGKLPVVLSPHGHWKDGRLYEASDAEAKKAVASGAEKTLEGAKFPLQARPAGLARLGCIVFQYDMVGYADSTAIEHRKGFNDPQAELRLQNFMGLQTWNSIRALDFMLALPDADPARVAITGASGGGTQTMILAAIDPRVTCAVPAVMVSENMQGGCICENSSLLRVGTNNIEFAAAFAPKPQGMTGADDWTKNIETHGLPALKKIYGFYDDVTKGAADNVEAWYRPFPHNYNQVSRELMYNFLNKHLKLGHPSPVMEKPFEPVPPKQLSVWDDQHKPTDHADAAALRKTMEEQSDRALNHMIASDPQEYRRVITAALRTMVNDKWPTQAAVDGKTRTTKADGYTIEAGLLTRPSEGALTTITAAPDKATGVPASPVAPTEVVTPRTSVPFAMLTPADWNGETVLWIHPGGKATLLDGNGKPLAPVQRILDAKFAVLSGDLFMTGEFVPDGADATRPVNKDFAGYTFGYNRTVLAERVHDILTLVAYAKAKESKFVHQVAWEGAGHWGLLAKGLAGEAILRSAIDLNQFDFDKITDAKDENFLPGALKYGGVMTFVSLCRVGETALYRLPEGKDLSDIPLPARGVRVGQARMVDWVIRAGGIDSEEVPRR